MEQPHYLWEETSIMLKAHYMCIFVYILYKVDGNLNLTNIRGVKGNHLFL